MSLLFANSARIAGSFNAQGLIYVDGNAGLLSFATWETFPNGVVPAVATVDFKSEDDLAGPDILSRGFIYM